MLKIMWCQEECLIKKAFKLEAPAQQKITVGGKATSSFHLCIIPNTQTPTQTQGLTIFLYPFLSPPIFLFSILQPSSSSSSSPIHFAYTQLFCLWVTKRPKHKTVVFRLSHQMFSGFCPRQHSVATVTSYQRFLLNPH